MLREKIDIRFLYKHFFFSTLFKLERNRTRSGLVLKMMLNTPQKNLQKRILTSSHELTMLSGMWTKSQFSI